jgi:hypothetical protein
MARAISHRTAGWIVPLCCGQPIQRESFSIRPQMAMTMMMAADERIPTVTQYLLVLTLLLSILVFGTFIAGAQEQSLSKMVFHVACYDVGRSALEDPKGADRASSGFHGFKEANAVNYQPSVITPE